MPGHLFRMSLSSLTIFKMRFCLKEKMPSGFLGMKADSAQLLKGGNGDRFLSPLFLFFLSSLPLQLCEKFYVVFLRLFMKVGIEFFNGLSTYSYN